jgi:hypothetical protein
MTARVKVSASPGQILHHPAPNDMCL